MEQEKIEFMLATLPETGVYIIGFSFILGSLFTILILLLLDFTRRNKTREESSKE